MKHDLQTPCFVLDREEMMNSIDGFRVALERKFHRFAIGYSVKTNSLPTALRLAGEMGCLAEVVSADEYELARKCGFTPDKMIYNGPMKSKETFLETIIGGGKINIETHRELDWLRELPGGRDYSVGLRLNVNISQVSAEDADGDNDNSRFGFSDETDEFNCALSTIKAMPHVRLTGLHIHRTAHSRSVRFYRRSIEYACETMRKYNLKVDYLDIGGGYFGIFPNKPTYQEYAEAFYDVLRGYGMENVRVIVEPGNALVASCFSFVSEVIDVKRVEDKLWFVTTDGSRNDIDPFFRKTRYLSEIVSSRGNAPVLEQVISGCTCLEYDRLFSLRDYPLLSVGDRIIYHNVGAYTMTLSPMFIRYWPAVYLKDGDDYRLVRRKWTANEYLAQNL